MSISNRIEAMAACIDSVHSLADIGTDHGYLPQYLLEHNKIQHAVLTDVHEGPLDNARRAFEKNAPVVFRLGNGLAPIALDEVEAAVIAGMGGELIRSILENDIEKAKHMRFLLLQPMTEQSTLRTWLLDNGFKIVADYYVKAQQKIYEIIKISFGDPLYSPETRTIPSEDLEFGFRIAQSSLDVYDDFLLQRMGKYRAIYDQTQNTPHKVQAEHALKKMETIETIRKFLIDQLIIVK